MSSAGHARGSLKISADISRGAHSGVDESYVNEHRHLRKIALLEAQLQKAARAFRALEMSRSVERTAAQCTERDLARCLEAARQTYEASRRKRAEVENFFLAARGVCTTCGGSRLVTAFVSNRTVRRRPCTSCCVSEPTS